MNDKRNLDQETYRTFQLMTEIESGEAVSQRELARRLGVAVGLVNSYLKNFVAKGYVRVKNYPRNRYSYLLTPKGFAEKTRLAYQHLSYFNNLYTVVRRDYQALFCRLAESAVKGVIFCGVDEVAEIAYLSMRDAGMELVGVIDEKVAGQEFFGHLVKSLDDLGQMGQVPIVVTSIKQQFSLSERLMNAGIPQERILTLQDALD